jgi:hypothetical protein
VLNERLPSSLLNAAVLLWRDKQNRVLIKS